MTILAGFLGSGKTTRVNALLHDPQGRRIAVILNELGSIGIEADKLASAEEFVELDGGCICCAINADLENTLQRLRDRGGFDHLVIETTGIADPLPVAWTLERGGLRDGYRVDAIVTVVDAVNLERALAEGPEAALQIERADVLLLSKLDLPGSDPAAVEARLDALNPTAPRIRAPRDATPWDMLLDTAAPDDGRPVAEPHHHHESQAWQTWSWRTTATVSDAALEDFLRAMPPGVFRAKGRLRTDADPPWFEVHAVGGRYEMEAIPPPADGTESVLVCIGRRLDAAALDAAAATFTARAG